METIIIVFITINFIVDYNKQLQIEKMSAIITQCLQIHILTVTDTKMRDTLDMTQGSFPLHPSGVENDQI